MELDEWLRGQKLLFEANPRHYVLKLQRDTMGCWIPSNDKLLQYSN